MAGCAFAGCGRKHRTKGLCATHYLQSWRGQEPKAIATRAVKVPATSRDNAGRKHCAGCGKWLREEQFGIRRATPDGLNGYCKPCHSASAPLARRRAVDKRRALALSAESGCWFARDDAVAQLVRDVCVFCGEPGQAIEHIDPLSVSLDDSADNLSAACNICNSQKGTKSLLVFLLDRMESHA